ncbi:MAG: acyl-CoA dehydrogenase family protein [Rhodobacter sp.]|nr:acyl-CoA dehydrogenase family protein [Rhodobacter sp.]
MDFEPTEERRLLAETLARFLAAEYSIEHRNSVAYSEPFHDPVKWRALADLGVLHALAAPADGGMGGAGFDIATVFETLGAALCPEPFLGALLSVRLLAAAGCDLAPLLSGQIRYAAAVGETDAPYDPAEIGCEAHRGRNGWVLHGRKSVVYGGASAERLVIAARADGGALALWEVAASDARISGYGMIDGGNAAEVFLDGTPAAMILPEAGAALQDALDHGALALCAEAVGAMDTAQAMLLDYLQTRRQFGRPIGSFQALQHRMVDLTIEIEQARSITILAAGNMGTDRQTRTVSMAKNLVGRMAKLVAEELIQMHGGIAMTWEYPASHFAKRLVMIDHQLGDTDFHLHRVMAEHMRPGNGPSSG